MAKAIVPSENAKPENGNTVNQSRMLMALVEQFTEQSLCKTEKYNGCKLPSPHAQSANTY